jgi:hypothetical protein
MGSYGVGIGRAWCSWKACEIRSSLVQKKKLKKNYFSSHKLPKQQSTSFWSQGILGVNKNGFALGVIPLVNKNGLYDMKMGNLFRSILPTPTIPTIKNY